MRLLRGIRFLALLLATGALATTALGLADARPAAAAPSPGLCTLLPVLCPTTTTPTTKPAATTTKPPATTPPTTARPAVRATVAARTSTVNQGTGGVSSVGDGVLPAPAAAVEGPVGDDAAPQLAVTPSPSSTVVTFPLPDLSGLVGTTAGLPDDHARLRIGLSLVVLLIGIVALAQLPASRRSPGAIRPPPS
jgi:hypothetical protein